MNIWFRFLCGAPHQKRNWLHVGRTGGGHRAATLFTLMVSCRRLGLEPYGCLSDILGRLGTDLQKDIWKLAPRGARDARARRNATGPPPSSPAPTTVAQILAAGR